MIALLALSVLALVAGVLIGVVAALVAIIKTLARAGRDRKSKEQPTRALLSTPEEIEFHRIVAQEWPSS